jgi:hypothetical protein
MPFIPTTTLTQGTSEWTQVLKTVTESVASNTVVQNDDELFFTAVASTLYAIEVGIIYDSPVGAGTPDIKVAFGEDGTARGQLGGVGISTADGSGVWLLATSQAAGTFGTTTLERLIGGTGFHRGNGGTFLFQWAQNTSGINATRVVAGSWLRYRVIS